eukprot:CAMPEP_0203796588 /NCGR_PEP_ID=MMETSP0100_2-20121128/8045_1 /ASSEMBLY_ACC=CAM_ASM_000210 /TAXON_ID=96639 /ORGANISM=" , Strain NY0313808BC1" /LENGTH=65 /DNA_ID=CAMNT_0050701577 /DNA_START=50 /DNA_END=247 /DNA_ORIENTATION=-
MSQTDDIALEVELISTCAAQMFEKVAVQAVKVNQLCQDIETSTAFVAHWNRFFQNGAALMEEEED